MTLRDLARLGRTPPDLPIFDCHGHAGPYYNYSIPEPWIEGILRSMDSCGIQRMVIAPHLAICPDAEEGNRLALAMADKAPDRLLPYCTVNPRRPGREIVSQLELCVASGRAVGVKLHPSLQGTPVGHEGYGPAFDYAEQYGRPVLVHAWEGDDRCSPDAIARVAEQRPKVQIILAHSAGAHGGMMRCVEVARRLPNLWLEISGSSQPWGAIETLVGSLGPERVLFGSDTPFIDPRPKVGAVLFAGISDAAKRMILCENGPRLFGLAGVDVP